MIELMEPVELDDWLVDTPRDKDAPSAPVRLVAGRHVTPWRVVRCPYCGGQHDHSAGGVGEDPRRFLGGRVAHCHPDDGDDEYRLIAIAGDPSREEIDADFPTVGASRAAARDLVATVRRQGCEVFRERDVVRFRHRAGNPPAAADLARLKRLKPFVVQVLCEEEVARPEEVEPPIVAVAPAMTASAARRPVDGDARALVWDKSHGRCWYCGVAMHPFRTFHVDHVLPIADGGTNDLTNLVPACQPCNQRKHARPADYLRRFMADGLFWFEREESVR